MFIETLIILGIILGSLIAAIPSLEIINNDQIEINQKKYFEEDFECFQKNSRTGN